MYMMALLCNRRIVPYELFFVLTYLLLLPGCSSDRTLAKFVPIPIDDARVPNAIGAIRDDDVNTKTDLELTLKDNGFQPQWFPMVDHYVLHESTQERARAARRFLDTSKTGAIEGFELFRDNAAAKGFIEAHELNEKPEFVPIVYLHRKKFLLEAQIANVLAWFEIEMESARDRDVCVIMVPAEDWNRAREIILQCNYSANDVEFLPSRPR